MGLKDLLLTLNFTNSKPTKGNVVWRSLVDVNQVKATLKKLKECNWLYKDVSDESVDSAAKDY